MILFTGSGALATTFAKYYSCRIISARFLNDDELKNITAVSKTIFHNSACISSDKLSTYLDSNLTFTKRIIDIAYDINPNIRFVNISSMSILKTEDTYLNLSEMTNYALSKYFAELYCLNHPMNHITNIRFSTIFYQDPIKDGLSKLAYDAATKKKITLYNNGEASRDFIPINVIVKYLYNLSKLDNFPRKINIVSGRSLSFKHFVDILIKKKPEIEIESIISDTKMVLDNFGKNGVNQIGEIKFDIDLEFMKYFNRIYASFNL